MEVRRGGYTPRSPRCQSEIVRRIVRDVRIVLRGLFHRRGQSFDRLVQRRIGLRWIGAEVDVGLGDVHVGREALLVDRCARRREISNVRQQQPAAVGKLHQLLPGDATDRSLADLHKKMPALESSC